MTADELAAVFFIILELIPTPRRGLEDGDRLLAQGIAQKVLKSAHTRSSCHGRSWSQPRQTPITVRESSRRIQLTSFNHFDRFLVMDISVRRFVVDE